MALFDIYIYIYMYVYTRMQINNAFSCITLVTVTFTVTQIVLFHALLITVGDLPILLSDQRTRAWASCAVQRDAPQKTASNVGPGMSTFQ